MGRFPMRRGVGRRLRNGSFAVPVVRSAPCGSTPSVYFWDLDLACGCSLRRHRTWVPRVPGVAGCPVGHGREVADARARAAAAGLDVEAAVDAVLASWDLPRGSSGAE